MSKLAIELPDGNTVEVDGELLKGYKDEAFKILGAEAKAKRDFKEAIEAQAEALGIPKKFLSKYLKTAYKEQTKEQSALAEFFAALDDATEEVLSIND